MFSPSQHDVRAFFCETWRKQSSGLPLSPIELQAARWISAHPEYQAILADVEAAQAAVFEVEEGKTNPFLHLSMHLSIEEQVAIDQPRGIRQAVQTLGSRLNDLHLAHHQVMDCLGEMIWTSQRNGLPPDPHAYLACVHRRAGPPKSQGH